MNDRFCVKSTRMSTRTTISPPHLSMTLCSQCSSMAHFQCIDHCHEVFCGKCSMKHRTAVMRQMDQLKEELKRCQIDPVSTHDQIDENFRRSSEQTMRRTQDTVKNLIAEIYQREETIIKEIQHSLELRQKDRERRTDASLLTSEEAIKYKDLLNECTKQDQLINSETMMGIQQRLDARNALGQSASEARPPLIELGKFEPEKILHLRHAPRAEKSTRVKSGNVITVTVRLGKSKQFQSPLHGSFSVGKHPTAISLEDRYVETFFCRRTPGNSLILLSTTAIDVVNRGSGVEMSVRLSKILGTAKDKFLAGTWCEYSQRLILVGNHRMYIFDLQKQEHARRFRCQPAEGDPGNTARFLSCTYDGSIIYGYKSAQNVYTIEKYSYPSVASQMLDDPEYEDRKHFFQPQHTAKINGRIAAMCITYNRIALIYRQFEESKPVEHFLGIFDHNLTRINQQDIKLPSEIKWITAMTSFGNDGEYLLCDPRGQQLLLYRSTEKILIRRFRVGAINACCLTDGKLVLWLQKQYASSPTGKLHFITAPHLEEPANVAKSLPLLTAK